MLEVAAVTIAFFGLQATILGTVWNLRGQLAKESLAIRESINRLELSQATDREKFDGRIKLLESEFEGLMERTDYRFSLLSKRIEAMEKK